MASIAIHASPDLKDMKRDRDVEAFRFLLKRTKRERVHLSGRGNREGEEAAKTCNPVETSQTAECDVFVFLFLILFWWQQGVRVRRRYIPFFIDPCIALRIYSEVKLNSEGFAGGPVVMNLLANEGDTKFDPLSGKIPWRRKWQPVVFSPGKFHGQSSLVGYSPWGCKRVGYNLATKEQLVTISLFSVSVNLCFVNKFICIFSF